MVVALAMTVGAAAFGQLAQVRAPYVGDFTCEVCHPDHCDHYMLSGHPYEINYIGGVDPHTADSQWPHTLPPVLPATFADLDADGVGDAQAAATAGLEQTDGAGDWSNVGWIIGNYFWKARWVDTDGYILTGLVFHRSLAFG